MAEKERAPTIVPHRRGLLALPADGKAGAPPKILERLPFVIIIEKATGGVVDSAGGIAAVVAAIGCATAIRSIGAAAVGPQQREGGVEAKGLAAARGGKAAKVEEGQQRVR